MTSSTPSVLTIAGSDPSGGAGIQADLKTFTALQCYGAAVLTALTAQNTVGVRGIHACPPDFVEQQLRLVLEDIPIRAIKTGMLTDEPTVQVVVKVLEEIASSERPPLVVDPVMVSTSGHRLLESSAISIIQTRVLPLATIVTPNLQEAEILLSPAGASPAKLTSIAQVKDAARSISRSYGVPNVLIKGGHLDISSIDDDSTPDTTIEYADICDPQYPAILVAALNPELLRPKQSLIVDVLYTSSATSPETGLFVCFVRPRIDTQSTHGTGCTLSAAIASELAQGHSVVDATRAGIQYTHRAIANAFTGIGAGHGPLNHMHTLSVRTLPPPTPSAPHPFISAMIASTRDTWDHYVKHEFVQQLGAGVLSIESFKHFITQDYIYLKYYARAHGLLALKSTSFASISASALIMQHIARESTMHESYCATFGIPISTLTSSSFPEASATTAYGAFILDVGLKGDALSLLVALAACLIGYGEVGLWLKKEDAREGSNIRKEGNVYRKWMEDYGGPDYQEACMTGIRVIEERIAADPPTPAKYAELAAIWKRCVELERGFWDMAINLST